MPIHKLSHTKKGISDQITLLDLCEIHFRRVSKKQAFSHEIMSFGMLHLELAK